MIRTLFVPLCTILLLVACGRSEQNRGPQTLLVFASQNAQEGVSDLQQMQTQLADLGIAMRQSNDSDILNEDSLFAYGAVLFWDIDFAQLDIRQQADLERYVQSGGGVLSINSELEVPYTWPWMDTVLVQSKLDKGKVISSVADIKTSATTPGFKSFAYDGGRIALATSEWSQGFSQAVRYAIGANTYNLEAMRSPRAPKDNRFTKVVLDDHDINEPMELAVLDRKSVV